ncbi:hypothetical protein DWY45_13290 [Phocaeicola plebeius]|jgi:hypothetical protein|uniref:Uncharacterized protein n=1 Tax=Phocaeicola plebeius TaxID=310297 RepID=A0A414R6V9_9BACT|nr:hypothetical protein DWY45_13290 [Phocaeicola plebeius]RHF88753.1 hypothetical protein DW653_11650 [Phocaeicola plebeius]
MEGNIPLQSRGREVVVVKLSLWLYYSQKNKKINLEITSTDSKKSNVTGCPYRIIPCFLG